MSEQDESRALGVLDNRVRRQILKHLVREPHYPLQLAQLLDVSQQAIVKHLKVLEEANFVMSERIPSEKGGPPRKVYSVTQSFQLQVVVGPDIFLIEHRSLPHRRHKELEQHLPDNIKRITENLEKKKPMVQEVIDSLARIDEEIEALGKRRDALLSVRQHIRTKAHSTVDELPVYEERNLIHHVLDQPGTSLDPNVVSNMLSVNASEIESALDAIQSRIMVELSLKSDAVLAGRPSANLPWWMVKRGRERKSGPF
ncbi:MAG: hypothetical protein CMB77_01160 [Euryarchaeota archaeon]|nr:hypothetical protein [Euryarchaeota archaeon]